MDLRELPDEPFLRHPWETARARFFLGLLGERGAFDAPRDVLDVGAGDGWFGTRLLSRSQPGTRLTLWDRGYTDTGKLEHARPGVERTAEQPAAAFDLVLLMDVIEHVPDDRAFLRGVVTENARPGATVLVSVPAWQVLYSNQDRAIHHYRRYSPTRLSRVVEDVGLTVMSRGGLFHSLLVPRGVTVVKERLQGATGDTSDRPDELRWNHGRFTHQLVSAALRVDNAVSAWAARVRVSLPGLTAWVLCRV